VTGDTSPTLSIVTAVYNGKEFIAACISSVASAVEDSGPNAIEHMIVDGGSTDGTAEIIESFAASHPHIRYVSEPDQGQSDAMNKGLALASGRIVSFLNADDFYEPGALADVLRRFELLDEPALLIGNCGVVDREGGDFRLRRPETRCLSRMFVIWRYAMPFNPSAYFYHRSLHDLVGGFDVAEHFAMDYDFLVRAYRRARVTLVDEHYGNMRYYEGAKTFDSERDGLQFGQIERVFRTQAAREGRLYRLLLLAELEIERIARGCYPRPSIGQRVLVRSRPVTLRATAALLRLLDDVAVVRRRRFRVSVSA
jgi:glycosyltransferase involved in cell wall biosynthesis